MGIQDSLSGLKEKIKLKLPGKKRKPSDTGAGALGEGDDPANSLPQPVPHVVADGGHDGGEGGSNADGYQVGSTDQLPRPDELESASNDQEGGEADVGVGEASQHRSDLRPDVEVGMGIGSGREGNGNDADGANVDQVHPSLSIPSILQSEEPDGTRMRPF